MELKARVKEGNCHDDFGLKIKEKTMQKLENIEKEKSFSLILQYLLKVLPQKEGTTNLKSKIIRTT